MTFLKEPEKHVTIDDIGSSNPIETNIHFKKYQERSRTKVSRGVLGAHSAYKKSLEKISTASIHDEKYDYFDPTAIKI